MRGAARLIAPAILGLLVFAAGVLPAQQTETHRAQLQADAGPFAEETRLLDAAADKAARREAFAATQRKAAELRVDPAPLVAILRNKKPEETFAELMAWIREVESARHASFLPLLITTASEAGDSARAALHAIRAYELSAVDSLRTMLHSEIASDRAAALAVCAERIGGARGSARLIPSLVKIACEGPPELQGHALAALKRLTMLAFEKAQEWKDWLGEKTEIELLEVLANLEHEARRKAEKRQAELEAELTEAVKNRMRVESAGNAPALVDYLNNGPYPGVRSEAARLLRELMPRLTDDEAAAPIEALGAVLNRAGAPDELRMACLAALMEARGTAAAESRKPLLAFAQIDKALESNGVSADLKVELVKALNSPVAASRLTLVLRAAIDQVETRSGKLLETALLQVRAVLEVRDTSPSRDALLAELARLVQIVAGQLENSELAQPARKRFVSVAVQAAEALQQLARLREIDISPCVDGLLRMIAQEGAAAAAMAALREATTVPSAQVALRQKLSSPPVSGELEALYRQLLASRDDALMISLLQLCRAIALAPEPAENLRLWLLEQARQAVAELPPNVDIPRTRRDAVRALLGTLHSTTEQHVSMVRDLLDCPFGARDAQAYLLGLRSGRLEVMARALTPEAGRPVVKSAQLLAEIAPALPAAERTSAEFKTLREAATRAARSEIASWLESALADGVAEESRARLAALGAGPLRDLLVMECVARLKKSTARSDARDALAELLLTVLRQAHTEKYDRFALKGLEPAAFDAELEAIKAQLKRDGYGE